MQLTLNPKVTHPPHALRIVLRFAVGVIIYTSFVRFLASDGGMGIVHFFMATTGKVVQWITPGSGGAIIGINLLVGIALLVIPLAGVKLVAKHGVNDDPMLKGLVALFKAEAGSNFAYRLLMVIGLVIFPLKAVGMMVAQFVHAFGIFRSWESVSLGGYLREYAMHAPFEIMGFGMVAMASCWTCKEALKKLRTMDTADDNHSHALIAGLSIWQQKTSTTLAITGLATILISGILEISSIAAVS